jgi:hypothetical protein
MNTTPIDHDALRKEWNALVAEDNALRDEGQNVYWTDPRATEIWQRTKQIKRRIAEIAAMGVTFD